MSYIEDLICDLGECEHKPVQPYPRAGFVGENVYFEKWQEWMQLRGDAFDDDDGESNFMLRNVLGCMMRNFILTQRHATVAASVITWLGTNCGRGFLEMANRMEKESTGHGRGYVMAWAIDNRRVSSVNGGFRLLEHILAGREDRDMRTGVLRFTPDLSAEDYEVAESVVMWLSTDEGQAFIKQCETEISKRNMAEKIADCVARKDYRMLKFYLKDIQE